MWRCLDHVTPLYQRKSALLRRPLRSSVGIDRLRTERHWIFCLFVGIYMLRYNRNSVRLEDFTAVTEECRLLGYKTQVRTSQETYYVSVTELCQLKLFKIWGLNGSDYEECRLLGYKTPVRTSQETHYVSTTEPSQLTLCKIRGIHRSDWRMLSSGI
jgi:hypothetical protein